MKIAWRITHTAHLLGAAGFALLLAGCADQQPTAPTAKTVPTAPNATKLLDLSKKPDFRATVVTVQTWRDKSGKIQRKKFPAQKLKATFKEGLAHATVDVASTDLSTAMFASATDAGRLATFAQQYTTDPTVLTPVLGAASGELAYNYADTVTDAGGNVIEFYGWAPYAGIPITDAWAYRNGVLIAQYHADWSATTGGYLLAEQKVGSYERDGVTLAGTLESTVYTGGGGGGGPGDGPLMTKNESLGEKFAAPFLLALDKAGCWLSPQVAYAAVSCTWELVEFGLHSFVLGEMTYTGVAFVAPPWYLVQWGVWTKSLYEVVHCFDSRGHEIRKPTRGSNPCKTNPRLCTGGGGSTW